MNSKHLIVIAGPTASGKTAVSLELAQTFACDIFNADSRQFYRGLDIGTAKPTPEELELVTHHFIDTLDPDDDYNAGRYAKDLNRALSIYFEKKDIAIVVGGSGLYIKAAIEGIDALPSTPKEVRDQYADIYREEGIEGLQNRLKELDPSYFSQVDIHNPQRLQRALEAIQVSGKTFSELRRGETFKRGYTIHGILLMPPREAIYEKINNRVDEMMAMGLLEEVKKHEPFKACNALQTVGYKELFEYLDGQRSKDEAITKIKQHTRNYAKRQRTWFKKQEGFTHFTEINIDAIKRHLKQSINV